MSEDDDESSADAMLITFLHDRTVFCPACGYNLRNLSEPRCPECGDELRLGVRLSEPRIVWPVAGLLGLATGAGFSLMMVAYIAIVMLVRHISLSGQLRAVFLPYIIAPAVIQSMAIWIWLRNWNIIRRLPRTGRIVLVSMAWLLPVITIFLFSLNVR